MPILVRIPSYSRGNIGDAALISTFKDLYPNAIMPTSQKAIDNVNLDNIDCLCYFGNDCMAYYGISTNIISKCLKRGKNVYIINTSWGKNPKKMNLSYLKSISQNPNLYVFIRDKYSLEMIKKDISFANNPELMADLGILCRPVPSKVETDIDKWISSRTKPIIGINTHTDFKQYNDNVLNTLKQFMIDNQDRYDYILIPHDSRKSEHTYLENLKINDDCLLADYLDPNYEKYITSKFHMVITGRMHLSILTVPNGVPAICIAYNGVKAKGTLSHWGIDDLVIEPQNIGQINDFVKNLEDNHSSYVDKIRGKNPSVEDLSRVPLTYLS